MPRANVIWVVSKGSFILGAFTVKHELRTWLLAMRNKYGWQEYEISITRTVDANPEALHKCFRMEEIING